ncbi:hypothetical protein ACIHCX_03645 [Streptomyces sp. NPDC052043]|uniref:hypothetical protein n=1 Tax=Streptomyces sp. NPDC052043 TaxID=3365684 RepID=UPI0037CEE5ED
MTVYGVWEPVSYETITNRKEWWDTLDDAKAALRERLSRPGQTTVSRQRLVDGTERVDAQFYGTPGLCAIFLYETPDAAEPYVLLDFGPRGGVRKRPAPYCMGLRCEDCTSDEPCCEATCGACPRSDCYLAPGSEENSRYCDEHGEGWLYDLPPHAQRMSDILHSA